MIKEVKLNGKRLLLEEEDNEFGFRGIKATLHESEFKKANDYRSYAVIDDEDKIMRFNKQIGVRGDIKLVKEISDKDIDKYKLKTQEANFSDLEGQKIISFKDDDTPNAFWGDSVDRFIIKTEKKVYVMETGGGTSFMGFPGSQSHGVWLEEILNPELLAKG